MFIDRLLERIIKKRNPSVMGLDPLIEYVPPSIREKYSLIYGNTLKACAEAILEFNKNLLDAVYDIIPAVKPQSAYYEMYGSEGIRTLIETIRYAKEKGFIVIVDAKRNDIGSTATAYSSAYLGKTVIDENISQPVFDADALTVNGYLGIDGIKPMLECCDKYGKGIFVLVKTSNPSSVQLQDIVTDDGRRVYEVMADLVHDWGTGLIGEYGYSSAGAVVEPHGRSSLKFANKNAANFFPCPRIWRAGRKCRRCCRRV